MSILFLFSVAFMTLCGSVGAILFKKVMNGMDRLSVVAILKNPNFYLGGFCYAIGVLVNIILMRFFDYTVVYPSTSFTYVWTIIISYIVLKEKINAFKLSAVAFIIAGVLVMNI